MSHPRLFPKHFFSLIRYFSFQDTNQFKVCHPAEPSPRDLGLNQLVIKVVYQHVTVANNLLSLKMAFVDACKLETLNYVNLFRVCTDLKINLQFGLQMAIILLPVTTLPRMGQNMSVQGNICAHCYRIFNTSSYQTGYYCTQIIELTGKCIY